MAIAEEIHTQGRTTDLCHAAAALITGDSPQERLERLRIV